MTNYLTHKYTFSFKSDDGGSSDIQLMLESDRQALNVGYARLYMVKQASSVSVYNYKKEVLATLYKKGDMK